MRGGFYAQGSDSANEQARKGIVGLTRKNVQESFFLGDLPVRNGEYWNRERGLNAPVNTIVLFQFDGAIIAAAIFIKREAFEEPDEGYRGKLLFDPSSMMVFDPIEASEMRTIWPDEFMQFGNTRTELSAAKYAEFELRLSNIRRPALPAILKGP